MGVVTCPIFYRELRIGGIGTKPLITEGNSGTRCLPDVIYNGKQLFEVEDSTFKDAGQVGLWTKADSVTLFDEVSYGEAK